MPRKPAKHPAKPKRGKKLEIEEPGVLYGRYSSHNQKDISVEQQFEKGYELAAEYGIRIIDTYADRAVSGRTDKRRDFQRMMTDAAKGKFRYVIAWKSNRMGRNMLEALINEARLQDLGVRVLYVEEDFDDTAAGRFAARSMMNVNQFYSENMAEDIKRGLYDNAANCMVANGHLPYGYKADETLHYAIDEPKAAVIREIFTRVSCGEAFVDIMASLNARGIKTSYGRPWGRSSFQKILSNERYRGIYIYGDVRKEGGIPRIISDELYFKVQEVITTKKNPQGRHRVNGDYLLTGKLFCGHCKSPMTGVSGTGRSGNLHYYYVCQKRRTEKTCDKKNVRRDEIELQVAQAIKDYALKDDVIEWIADSTVAYNERKEAESKVGILEDQLAGTEHGIKNIMSAIEQGIITETTKSRLVELESERATIKANIAAARADIVTVSRDDIISGLEMFRDGDVHDKKYQARLFDTFLVAVYAYDDDLRLVFSFSGNKNTIQIPIESAVNAVENNEAECSFKLCSAPPKRRAPLCGALLFGIRGTFNSAQTNELLVHQGFRTAKTLVTRHSARFLFFRRRLKGSLGPLFLQPQALDPFLHACHALAAAQALAGEPLCPLRASGSQNVLAAHAAAAGGGKGDDGLARKVVAFEERLDDARGLIPPDGKAHEHRVVLRHIRDLARDGGAALGVLHLDGAAALFIHPVQIGSGVGRLGRDLEEVAAGHTGKGLGKIRGLAAGGKIGN